VGTGNRGAYDIPSDYPVCLGCGHYRAGRCAALPTHIPLPTRSGEMHHLVPRSGRVGETVDTDLDLEVFRTAVQRVPAAPSLVSPTR
jgi:hypothetical protein